VPDQEVFLYDAARETLTCTSCNPSGAKPHGVLDQQHAGEGEGLLAERAGVWRGQVLAGSLPTWAYTSSRQALYQPRYLSDQGRLFFNSPDQLVPLPAGEQYGFKMNVYQYEPSGLGSCANPAGCVSLISSGTSDRESAFLDASADGSSAFFITRSQLVSVDHDTALDLYNARVCSAQSPCIQSPAANPRPCETSETCRPSPTPPATFQTPLSASVSGSGNETKVINRSPETGKPKPKPCTSRACKLKAALKKCHKIKKRKKRQACERAARTRYGPKKAHHRRGKR
jgi:hypothetical protein